MRVMLLALLEDKKIAEHSMTSVKGGKFDLIITKEISRFARNILDSIGYTRELKEEIEIRVKPKLSLI